IIDYFKRCKEAGNLREDISPKNCATIFIANFVPLIARFPIFLFQDPELEIEELIELQIEVLLHGLVPKK
ncbi:MAG: hypothetical protein U9O98_08140, partial [Asgard group archaeon]|nr:hypothetical protein [Asgard group archaeon]